MPPQPFTTYVGTSPSCYTLTVDPTRLYVGLQGHYPAAVRGVGLPARMARHFEQTSTVQAPHTDGTGGAALSQNPQRHVTPGLGEDGLAAGAMDTRGA